jgi:hypothetical protein
LDALKFGYNENVRLLGTFVFAAKHGLYFTEIYINITKNARGKREAREHC